MKMRAFNKVLNACRTRDRKRLDLAKVEALPTETKIELALFIVRNRGPLLAVLAEVVDKQWLASCGYLRATTGAETGLRFIHTGEHSIR